MAFGDALADCRSGWATVWDDGVPGKCAAYRVEHSVTLLMQRRKTGADDAEVLGAFKCAEAAGDVG